MTTGEELNRKYWELCGLEEIENVGGHWMYLDRSLALTAGGRWHSRLPRLDLDANLAIAEALKVFRRYDSGYRYKEGHVFWIDGYLIGKLSCIHDCSGRGETFCEAILKALLAAKETK